MLLYVNLRAPYTAGTMPTGPSLIAIDVGNTCTHIGQFVEGRFEQSCRFGSGEVSDIVQQVLKWWKDIADLPQSSVVLASVDAEAGKHIALAVEDQLSIDVYRVEEDLPIPIGRQLDPETITGVDRLLNAAAAYEVVQQACVVIDAGSAVTVDFVDGEGTFHGGAIAPGATMQLQSMAEHTAALPEITFCQPDADAFGRSTTQAMLHGVYHGIRGMIWKLVELYAQRYGAYPLVIATGGDAETLFADDELIDRCIPELTLMGIATTVRRALMNDQEPADDKPPAQPDPPRGSNHG